MANDRGTIEKFSMADFAKAMLNIAEDSAAEKIHLQEAQNAVVNILEDSAEERIQLEMTQKAVLNILEDSAAERSGLQDSQKAVLNILDDLAGEVEERKQAQTSLLQLNAELDERVRQRTAALEAANRELGAFSYSVSHDLRAPLRAIDGFGQRLVDMTRDVLDPTALHYLERIRAGTKVMAQLIEDLLSLSRISRFELNIQPVDISAMSRRIAGELQETEPERVVAWSIADDIIVEGDERLLAIVLQNLLGNAWKFTSKTAEPRIEFGATLQKGEMVYFVRDNGTGFDMAYADKLFAPFQRLHNGAEFPGTGIGLVTVRRIIQRHGGEVWVYAEVDKGATFYFTFGKGVEHELGTDTVS
ncbi:MAG TPA: ATP-binding protein [Candidatus Kapabacteria bacterium]|nr:ATP-binding protein [Candidatus Kapabacteria bacterium]